MATMDQKDIEERLMDHLGDAIGGEGSASIVSGGSMGTRHAVISHVLEEAEGMGCIAVRYDCLRSAADQPFAVKIASSFPHGDAGKAAGYAAILMEGSQEERSYRREMAILDLLRAAAAENTVVLALDELGGADRGTVDQFGFLARNIGGLNVLIIATHRYLDDDPTVSALVCMIGSDSLIHSIHLHGTASADPAPEERHEDVYQGAGKGGIMTPSASVMSIIGHLRSSEQHLAAGKVSDSVKEAREALDGSKALAHHGLELDSLIALGLALTHIGQESEALAAFDRAVVLARTLGEPISRHKAMMRRSELQVFSTGEPDWAISDAAAAMLRPDQEERFRIEPLALKALHEANNGRRDRAETAFCEASGLIEKFPVDSLILERMLLALAAASLLEGRFDLGGMNLRYREAQVLASGTEHPMYWVPTVLLQRGRSLLRLKRPREAKPYLEQASRQFGELGNAVQSKRAIRTNEEADHGIMLD